MKFNMSKTVSNRIFSLVDKESFIEIDPFLKSEVVAGLGYIYDKPVYIFAQDPENDGGAVSKLHCEKICKVYDLALKTGIPVLGIYDSVGARLKDGPDLFKIYGKILEKANKISGVVPQISLVFGPCIGTMSVIAMSSDFVIMTENAQIGISTSGDLLSSKDAESFGLTHINVVDENMAADSVRKLISFMPANNLDVMQFNEIDIRRKGNTGDAILDMTIDSGTFIETQKEFGKSFRTGIAQIGGVTIGIVSSKKQDNDKVIDQNSCVKAARLVRFCDAFSIPVLTFIDAVGFAGLKEASKISNVYAEATTIKISVVTGECYGAACFALLGKSQDFSFALDCSTISLLPPETLSTILYNDKLKGSVDPVEDRKKLFEEFKKTEASAVSAAQNGLIDDVVNKKNLRDKLFAILEVMSSKRVATLPKKHSNIQI